MGKRGLDNEAFKKREKARVGISRIPPHQGRTKNSRLRQHGRRPARRRRSGLFPYQERDISNPAPPSQPADWQARRGKKKEEVGSGR